MSSAACISNVVGDNDDAEEDHDGCMPSSLFPLSLQRLYQSIYTSNFTYVVHVDIKSEPQLIDHMTRYLEPYASNTYLIPSVR